MPTKKPSSILSSNAGFTLLEIIAVLVIMSILAVVAVPKYFDLQKEARNKTVQMALAEAIGRANSYFAKQVLSDTPISNINYATGSPLGTDLGDFELMTKDGLAPTDPATFLPSACDIACVEGDDPPNGCILLSVKGKSGTVVADADPKCKLIARPGI